jgi:hypothetical protein
MTIAHATERAVSAAWAWIVAANWLPTDYSKISKEVTLIVFSPALAFETPGWSDGTRIRSQQTSSLQRAVTAKAIPKMSNRSISSYPGDPYSPPASMLPPGRAMTDAGCKKNAQR